MMRIGVVSDTHSRHIPEQLLDDFQKVDFIVHAGDFCSMKDFEMFERIKPVTAVCGNMDEPGLRQKLSAKKIFPFGKFLVGLCHGDGPASKILEHVMAEFEQDKVDAVIFGHSHRAFNETIGGVLYFNPGTPNDIVCASGCSYGILEIRAGKLIGEIIKVKD